ncbi:Polysaccharide deacetylase [Stieleria neptunia]|uniref:Polysaccharide deacetylase n=1 Tax=Stieleria neptunia TaxID=2527979 RepID=A0A518HLH6_9BACT|nr:polysaccharide deacetylase family protein [Stieleria neptunia]QDV41693.1 Polysaccharide deacetylase [Stieleria neptunia]
MNASVEKNERAPASLSVDFDNKWAYLRAAGRQDWESASSYLPIAAERMVELLGELDLPLTVFVVGRDLRCPRDTAAIDSFKALQSVEFANHSMNHLPWMHTMDREEIFAEIAGTHQAIASALGVQPRGFRGPGFSCPAEVLGVLAQLDYAYDASVFPTSVAPIARAVFLARTKLKGEQKEKAKQLYGGFAAMRNPNRPFRRPVEGGRLWEIPVTVMPLTRTPIHFSYFLFLAGVSTLAAKTYLSNALRLCRWTGTTPSLLLHPPDVLGCEDDPDMAYFPGMKMPRAEKLKLVRWALRRYAQTFHVQTMIQQVRSLDTQAKVSQPHATQALQSPYPH